MIAAGASLQAIVGAVLVRRLVGFPTKLESAREVLRFVPLAGPVSSVVSATVGVGTLTLAGLSPWSHFGFSWTTWWVGDAIGATIVGPLVVISAVAPSRERWRRVATVALPLAVTFSLSVVLFTYASGREASRMKLELGRFADTIADALRNGVDRRLEVARSLANFIGHSPQLDEAAFRSFVRDPLSRLEGIAALAWDERVTDDGRDAFEALLLREGVTPAEITERSATGEIARAARRPEYLPIRWLEPERGNARARGFDVASDPTRREALRRAAQSGLAAVTAPITLVRETGGPSAFLAFVPVYASGDASAPDRAPRGYATAIFRVHDLVRSALAGLDVSGVAIRIIDATEPARPAAFQVAPGVGEGDDSLRFEQEIDVGGRRWRLVFSPTLEYLAQHRSLQAWNLLATGLLFTGLAGAFLLVLTGRSGEIEIQVAERTAELRRARRELQDFVDNMSTFNAKLDLDARFLLINRSAMHASGVTPEEIEGLRLYEGPWFAFDPAVAARVRHAFERAKAGSSVTYDERLKVADGRVLSIDFSLVPVAGPGGAVAYVVAEGRDISYQKQIGHELEAKAAALERSNAELERFAYVASHDLQEPLRMVGSYTQLLERRYRGKLDRDADEFIRCATDGVTRMQELIQDLLAYSRVGSAAPDFVPTDCEVVFREVLANLRVAIRESGATVTHDPLPTVTADRSQLVQLFQNLVANAIKFRGAEAPCVHVSAEPKDDGWVFAVADKGIGVDPQYADRIFVIFQRLHGRGEYAGTGIGLAICKKIVERLGGRIWVERPRSGSGSVFRLTIPVAREGSHTAA